MEAALASCARVRTSVARNRQCSKKLATVGRNLQTVTLQHNTATKLQAVASHWRARYAKLGGGTGYGKWGPHTAATDGPGGPNFAGDHVRRDSTTMNALGSRVRKITSFLCETCKESSFYISLNGTP